MSYRHDSEISDCAYGCAYSKTNTVESNFESFVQELEIEFNKRKIQAVWAVSNCKSKRIKYALELSQVFPVKVLGRCAHHFSRQESSEPFLVQMYKKSIGLFKSDACGRESECERELFDRSQFYLSFESRNCSDYITEKFWRILRYKNCFYLKIYWLCFLKIEILSKKFTRSCYWILLLKRFKFVNCSV